MKKRIRYFIIAALAVVLTAALIGRIVYVNVRMPHTSVKRVRQTDGFQTDCVTVRVHDAQLYTKEQWTGRTAKQQAGQPYTPAGNSDYQILLVNVSVDNKMEVKLSGFTVASNIFMMSKQRASSAYVYYIDNQAYNERSTGDINPGESKVFTYVFVCADWVTDDIYMDYYETDNNQRMKLEYRRVS